MHFSSDKKPLSLLNWQKCRSSAKGGVWHPFSKDYPPPGREFWQYASPLWVLQSMIPEWWQVTPTTYKILPTMRAASSTKIPKSSHFLQRTQHICPGVKWIQVQEKVKRDRCFCVQILLFVALHKEVSCKYNFSWNENKNMENTFPHLFISYEK